MKSPKERSFLEKIHPALDPLINTLLKDTKFSELSSTFSLTHPFFQSSIKEKTTYLKFNFSITNEALKAIIAEYPNLRRIDLSCCEEITDVSFLDRLKQLQSINLSRCCQITNISFLENLIQLQSINLNGCRQITDFSPLLECENLKRLILPEGRVLKDTQISEWLETHIQQNLTLNR